jgi:hypothetical protein
MKGDCMTDQEASTAAGAREQYANRCPCCEQTVPPDQAKVEIGDNGLIVAASLKAGIGPPLVAHASCRNYKVLLNGKEQDEIVAFDCKKGLVWRYQKDEFDQLIIRDRTVLIERLKGDVKVELRT